MVKKLEMGFLEALIDRYRFGASQSDGLVVKFDDVFLNHDFAKRLGFDENRLYSLVIDLAGNRIEIAHKDKLLKVISFKVIF